jgi:hypothetical protein
MRANFNVEYYNKRHKKYLLDFKNENYCLSVRLNAICKLG